MMQPERACLGSYLLEYAVGCVSLGLVYFAWQVLGQLKKAKMRPKFPSVSVCQFTTSSQCARMMAGVWPQFQR